MVDSIQIINQAENYVISPDGIFTLDKYYDYIYSYANYNTAYWKKFAFFDNSPYRVLSPSRVTYTEQGMAILPIIFNKIGNTKFNNLLVVDLSLDRILSRYTAYPMTDNTSMYLLNKYTGQVFSASDGACYDILNSSLHEKLLDDSAAFDFYLDDLKNVYIVKHTTTNSIIGYTYFSVVPSKDIFLLQSKSILNTAFIAIPFIIISILLSVFCTKRIIAPIREVAATYDPEDSAAAKNVLGHLQHTLHEMHQKNLDLTQALPFAQEKYLINFLNSAEYSIDEKTQNIIKDSLPFQHDFFATVILQLYPTPLFYQTYTPEEYNNIQVGFYNMIKQYFSKLYDVFLLSSEKETLYIILNMDADCTIEKIHNILDEVCDLLKYDSSYVRIYTGAGGIYKSLSGLRKAHTEAISSLRLITNSDARIIIHTTSDAKPPISDAEESLLYTTLLAFDTDKATEQIQSYTARFDPTNQAAAKQLYAQIVTIIFRVMRVKNIPQPDDLLDYQIYSDILTKPATDIWHIILRLLELLSSYQTSGETKTDVLNYIKLHFNDRSLSLDQLSDLFDLRPNYISSLIKNNLGIGYHEYVKNLKVAHAKKLLTETNRSIQEIYEEAGFSSRQTFFRVFKDAVGLTPNQYRKHQQEH